MLLCAGVHVSGPAARARSSIGPGRARQRADAHRARPARHAASELPGRTAALPLGRERPPNGADEARQRLDQALDQAEAAITDGRNAVQGLRASATTVNDLANGIAAVGLQLTSEVAWPERPLIDVAVDGTSRNLNPVVRDEAYRIAGEALRNAVKHASARRVTVTIHYEPRQLRLTVRDDGRGIDPETIARQQVDGHFGLPGMRERAAIVNGRLDVRSERGAGTEIELRVPAATAYRASGRAPRWSRLWRGEAEPLIPRP